MNKKTLLNIVFFSFLSTTIGFGGYFWYAHSGSSTSLLGQSTPLPEEIRGNIVTLKKLREEFFIDYHNMYSNIVREALECPKHITLDYTIRNLRWRLDNALEGKSVYYCIFDNKDNRLIGGLEAREKCEYDNGQFTCWLNEQYWGGGRLQEALKLFMGAYFAFKPQEKDILAHVRLWNQRSYRALKRAGFIDTGFFHEGGKPSRYLLEYRRP